MVSAVFFPTLLKMSRSGLFRLMIDFKLVMSKQNCTISQGTSVNTLEKITSFKSSEKSLVSIKRAGPLYFSLCYLSASIICSICFMVPCYQYSWSQTYFSSQHSQSYYIQINWYSPNMSFPSCICHIPAWIHVPPYLRSRLLIATCRT